MNITLDIILLAVLVISFVIGYKKGFVKSVWKIVALVVTIVLVLALKTPTVNFLAGSALANNISTKIAENVNIPQGGGVDIAETLNLPEFIQSDMTNQIDSTNNAVNSINEKTVMWLTNLCLTVIACVALFIIIRLILMAVYMIINGITEAPIIKGVNKFMGGIFAMGLGEAIIVRGDAPWNTVQDLIDDGAANNDKYNFYYIFVACTCINVCTGREQSV